MDPFRSAIWSASALDRTLEAQRKFFARNKAGCAFAAYAARNLERYGWQQIACAPTKNEIDAVVCRAAKDPQVTTLSMLFPCVTSKDALEGLIDVLSNTTHTYLEARVVWNDYDLYRVRARVNDASSWMTGFGPFDFLPATRRAPSTELTFRVKPRPNFDWHFKEFPDSIIHVADMDMRGLAERNLLKLWDSSKSNTTKVLGKAADEASAAKTTFALPRSQKLYT